jgi:hypothetical protein
MLSKLVLFSATIYHKEEICGITKCVMLVTKQITAN